MQGMRLLPLLLLLLRLLLLLLLVAHRLWMRWLRTRRHLPLPLLQRMMELRVMQQAALQVPLVPVPARWALDPIEAGFQGRLSLSTMVVLLHVCGIIKASRHHHVWAWPHTCKWQCR
jgi:hypothetical protein